MPLTPNNGTRGIRTISRIPVRSRDDGKSNRTRTAAGSPQRNHRMSQRAAYSPAYDPGRVFPGIQPRANARAFARVNRRCVDFFPPGGIMRAEGRDRMDQVKIGRFIAAKRKERRLTQEQLAELMHISKNAVSKWERGINLPDVSLMQELCRVLCITLNELFIGEAIPEEQYRAVADSNLLRALEHSAFTLRERVAFYKKKWRREHRADIILSLVCWIAVILVLRFRSVAVPDIAMVAGMLCVLLYTVLYHRMMQYVERRAYTNPRE